MTGGTADTSQFSEFEFYQWVMFRGEIAPFPEDNLILGKWSGSSTDVGPAMTAKILKSNGRAVHRSTFCELIPHFLHRAKAMRATKKAKKAAAAAAPAVK